MTTAAAVAGRPLSVWSRDTRWGTWYALCPKPAGARPLGALRIDRALLTPEGACERLAAAVLAVDELRLPGVLGTVDLVAEAGEVWLITARPPAPTLADILAADGPRPDAGSVASVLNETAQTLLALHAAGLAHGSLAADTVVLAPDGTALLAEPALAGTLGDARAASARHDDIAAWAALARTLGNAWAVAGTPAADLFARCSGTAESEGLAAARAVLVAGREALPAGFLQRTALRAAAATAFPDIAPPPVEDTRPATSTAPASRASHPAPAPSPSGTPATPSSSASVPSPSSGPSPAPSPAPKPEAAVLGRTADPEGSATPDEQVTVADGRHPVAGGQGTSVDGRVTGPGEQVTGPGRGDGGPGPGAPDRQVTVADGRHPVADGQGRAVDRRVRVAGGQGTSVDGRVTGPGEQVTGPGRGDRGPGPGAPDEQATVLGRRNRTSDAMRAPASDGDRGRDGDGDGDGEILLRFGPGVPVDEQETLRAPWQEATQATGSRRRRRRRQRRRAWCGVTVILTAIAVVLWLSLLRPTAGPAVTAAEVQAPTRQLHCGQTADVIGVMTTDGRAGPVTYRWLRSDGHDTGELTYTAGRGDRTATVHLRWTVRGPGRFRGTARLQVLHPRGTGRASAPIEAEGTIRYSCP